ncbi:MAG: efflux RND transporter periplasmic adaptor subunit [Acidobacteriota bacterium]
MLWLAGCSSGPAERGRGGRNAEPPPVEAVRAQNGTLPLEERVSGVVEASNQIAVRPRIEAPVVDVLVESGETVRAGAALVRLDDATLRERLRQAEASLRLARGEAGEARARLAETDAQVTRTRALAEQELVSQLELETQEARLEASQASLEQAEARVDEAAASVDERRADLDETLVRAPVAGTVGQRRIEVGQLVDPSTVLFELGDLETMRVEVPLTEAMLGRVRAGLPVRIASPALTEPLRADLDRVSPFLAEGSFSTVGEIELAADQVTASGGTLRPGMFVQVDILYGESEEATLVPTSALWDDPRTGVRGVFVITGGLQDAAPSAQAEGAPAELSEPLPVALREVDVLAEGRGLVGLRGVEASEWVVTLGQHLLSTGDEATARVRPTSWQRVAELQSLQREDLLADFLERQRDAARRHGAEPPSNEEFLAVDRATEGGSSARPTTPRSARRGG